MGESPGARWAGRYVRVLAWYLLVLTALWAIGIEGIYGSPLPFYALVAPACSTALVPALIIWASGFILWLGLASNRSQRTRGLLLWSLAGLGLALLAFAHIHFKPISFAVFSSCLWQHVLAPSIFLAGLAAARLSAHCWLSVESEPAQKTIRWFLLGIMIFSFAFAGAVAMIRDGTAGISQAYARHGYEYASDIGTTSGIQGLFRDYLKVRPYLSMHAKVHPPGPIALLWLFSYGIGQDPLPLSLATMAFGVLAILPLYGWVSDLAGRRTALIACILYSLMPSIVLFTATSADILFMPFTLTTLFLFTRAIQRRSVSYAVAAGVGYALMSLLSFSLIAVGAYFAFYGLWQFADKKKRYAVAQTAVVMLAAFLGLHAAVRYGTGFDIAACFQACKTQFETDQMHLDRLTPRFPAWTWRFLNPACWFYFAGIPVSLLFLGFARRAQHESPGMAVVMIATLLTLNLLYLARGEGERSAMYILPFVVLPAACRLDVVCREDRCYDPFWATTLFLAFQCWLTESWFYTFW